MERMLCRRFGAGEIGFSCHICLLISITTRPNTKMEVLHSSSHFADSDIERRERVLEELLWLFIESNFLHRDIAALHVVCIGWSRVVFIHVALFFELEMLIRYSSCFWTVFGPCWWMTALWRLTLRKQTYCSFAVYLLLFLHSLRRILAKLLEAWTLLMTMRR